MNCKKNNFIIWLKHFFCCSEKKVVKQNNNIEKITFESPPEVSFEENPKETQIKKIPEKVPDNIFLDRYFNEIIKKEKNEESFYF
jgi:hypothetical protein